MNRPSHVSLGILVGLVLSGCAPAIPSADPFAGATSRQNRNRPGVRVVLEVVCDQCLITFTAGPERGSVRPSRADQVWSHRFIRYPIGSELVNLRATVGEGRLERVRIFVNGDLAAIDQNGVGETRTTLCAATLIPRPADATAPRDEQLCGPA